jgi:hypothetical protein
LLRVISIVAVPVAAKVSTGICATILRSITGSFAPFFPTSHRLRRGLYSITAPWLAGLA